jgi:acyl-coenzyme A thioesterase PaaI-like protein
MNHVPDPSEMARVLAESWEVPDDAGSRGGAEFGPLIESLRLVQDRISQAGGMTAPVMIALTEQLNAVATELNRWQVPEPRQWAGRRGDLPGRGKPLLMPFLLEEQTDHTVTGWVVFRPFQLGGNGAAHGGTHALLFDDVLGKLANHLRPVVSRTAYLTVRYHRVVRIGVRLRVEGSIDKVEGRKTFTSARIFDDDTLLADAEGLFIALRPGQP